MPSLVHWILLTLGALDTLNSISTGKELETDAQTEKKPIMNEHICGSPINYLLFSNFSARSTHISVLAICWHICMLLCEYIFSHLL